MIDFAADTAAIFGDVLAEDATYIPQGGAHFALRVIRSRPDEAVGFGERRLVSDTAMFLVQAADLERLGRPPGEGDEIRVGEASYTVQGAPRRGERHLYWMIEARP